MHDLSLLEAYFKRFIKNMHDLIPEGIYNVDLKLLHHFNLLHFFPDQNQKTAPILTRYFHIIESPEKITLINDEFVIWIIPEKWSDLPMTYTLIALNPEDREPQLEAAFIAKGVYNSSKLVLMVLEKFLNEIHETEKILSTIK